MGDEYERCRFKMGNGRPDPGFGFAADTEGDVIDGGAGDRIKGGEGKNQNTASRLNNKYLFGSSNIPKMGVFNGNLKYFVRKELRSLAEYTVIAIQNEAVSFSFPSRIAANHEKFRWAA